MNRLQHHNFAPRNPRKPRKPAACVGAFTLIELLVVIAIIAMLIGILVPALSYARLVALRMKNDTQARGIATALILYAQSNDSRFPDGDVRTRFQALVDPSAGGGLAPAMLIATREGDSHYKVASTATLKADPTSEINYSYALLDRTNPEWRDNTNSMVPLVCDRKIISGATGGSIWNSTTWYGSVAWGDGHAGFERSAMLTTSVGGNTNTQDDLFTQAQAGKDVNMFHVGN